MKTLGIIVSCMYGALVALHDTPTFMSSALWVTVAVIGLLLLIGSSTLPGCRLANAFMSASSFALCIGVTTAVTVFFVPNNTVAGTICGIFIFIYVCISRALYTFANEYDKRERLDGARDN